VGEPTSRVARRRVQRIITEGEILDAAVALVDAEGLAALSMRRLAEATGVAPMTIYGFVASKDDLVARLGAHVLRELPTPLPEDRPWKERIVHEMTALRTALQKHHGLLELLSVGNDAAPVLDELRERLIGILRSAGLDDRTMVEGLGSLVALTLGFAVGGRARHAGTNGDIYKRLQSLPAQRFPNLRSAASHYSEHWSDRAFSYGLESVLATMEAAAAADPAH
jgi:AcrR family transcriptional regulator